MKDPVPEAAAGFISTLGVSLTQEQRDQLKTMLKRPPSSPRTHGNPTLSHFQAQAPRTGPSLGSMALHTRV